MSRTERRRWLERCAPGERGLAGRQELDPVQSLVDLSAEFGFYSHYNKKPPKDFKEGNDMNVIYICKITNKNVENGKGDQL